MRPLTPDQIGEAKTAVLPDFVIKTWNEILAKHAKGHGQAIKILQDDIVAALEPLAHNRDQIFENKWLDIEAVYEAVGWTVSYHKPAFNETGKKYFIFSPKNSKTG